MAFLWAPLALCTGACGGFGTAPATSSAPPVAAAPAAAVRSPGSPASSSEALEARIDELELRLLEARAQHLDVQARLDDARREVVRAMAKLQSQATRAEAASGMAEAEIALQALPPTTAGQSAAEGARLMKESTAEFDDENYGGALYLANEAKSAAAAARSQLAGADPVSARPDERSFAVSLPLQTTSSANVREGPGLSFAVLFVLPNGAPLTGHSAAEQWLRVTDESGRHGWISQRLIRARP
ncbi:MAG TPA: SH3 domain-containing protein [Gammaproteobacteria bacterium]|nr:SH3 domain-containing protein [Gammaproteobacteria bacterium]